MENKSKPYRSGRFYIVADEWFFSVRETDNQGPYSSKLIAEEGLKKYLTDNETFKEKKIFSSYLNIV